MCPSWLCYLLVLNYRNVSCKLSYFTDSFVFHSSCFIAVCTYWCIDLFSCTAARVSIKLTYLLTYLRTFIFWCQHIFRISTSSSYMKVTGSRSRSRSQEQRVCLCILFAGDLAFDWKTILFGRVSRMDACLSLLYTAKYVRDRKSLKILSTQLHRQQPTGEYRLVKEKELFYHAKCSLIRVQTCAVRMTVSK